jgi:hypothetical protein
MARRQRLDAGWVLCFGGPEVMAAPEVRAEVARRYPGGLVMGCSTAGSIEGARIYDDAMVVAAVRFAHTRVRIEAIDLARTTGDDGAGAELARRLASPDLVHVFLLSEGIHVNGTALLAGLQAGLPASVTVSGGLAADGAHMTRTVVLTSDAVGSDRVVAAGLYGPRLRVRCGSLGGWDPFGPERIITRSRGNVLYELDEQPALALYERYLGPHAAGLPRSGLLFPLEVPAAGRRTVRDPDAPGGRSRGRVDHLRRRHADRPRRAADARQHRPAWFDGATGAARACAASPTGALGLVVSCAGRRIVMGQRTEEELDAVVAELGQLPLTGFYSNGELSTDRRRGLLAA